MAILSLSSSGTENLLGISDGLSASEMRDRLALATRYLSNWYKATKGSGAQDAWWQQIDTVRGKVETTYRALLDPANLYFAGKVEAGMYDDASASWVEIYNRLVLSPDANQYGLLDQAADFVSTAVESPALFATAVGNEIGKAAGGLVGDAFGQFFARVWPVLLIGGIIGTVWIFREPLNKLASKAIT